jgi:hypothetical protein
MSASEFVSSKAYFNVIVDYNRSFQQMIQTGNYDLVNNDITAEHFPVIGQGKEEKTITLFHFNRTISSEDVISEMEKQGFEPAKIEDLLALGEKYPDLQKQFPIAALGSVWRAPGDYRRVPCLRWPDVKRSLNLHWREDVWSARWRFVALRK